MSIRQNPFTLASQSTRHKLSQNITKKNSPLKDLSRSAYCECPVCGNMVLEANINMHLDTECGKMTKETCSIGSNSTYSGNILKKQSILSQTNDLSGMTNSSLNVSTSNTINKNEELIQEINKMHLSLADSRKPLAERMRPKSFEDLFGNTELIGSQSMLRRILSKDPPPSLILYGPPGCGKTSIASIIQNHTQCTYKQLSATSAGVKDIKDLYDKAFNEYKLTYKPTILFLDEIHRFNKKQQDIFLPYVEKGILILIGATTEMPSFCINNALLSRCQTICLNKLNTQDISSLIEKAISTDPIILSKKLHFSDDVKYYLSVYCDGDGRKALNIIDMCINDYDTTQNTEITLEYIKELCANKFNYYDKDGEEHYNCISAYIKSIRGSDAQGAVYWLTRMIEGGEDPLYIARRMIISSSEDIGLADPMALTYSNNCFQAVKNVGMPECVYALVENTIYLALTSKSNECYLALNRARDVIQSNPLPPVPLHLRNSSTSLQEQMGYGQGYQYGYNKNQTYLPDGFTDYTFVDVYRSMRDLRIPSIKRYMNESKKTENDGETNVIDTCKPSDELDKHINVVNDTTKGLCKNINKTNNNLNRDYQIDTMNNKSISCNRVSSGTPSVSYVNSTITNNNNTNNAINTTNPTNPTNATNHTYTTNNNIINTTTITNNNTNNTTIHNNKQSSISNSSHTINNNICQPINNSDLKPIQPNQHYISASKTTQQDSFNQNSKAINTSKNSMNENQSCLSNSITKNSGFLDNTIQYTDSSLCNRKDMTSSLYNSTISKELNMTHNDSLPSTYILSSQKNTNIQVLQNTCIETNEQLKNKDSKIVNIPSEKNMKLSLMEDPIQDVTTLDSIHDAETQLYPDSISVHDISNIINSTLNPIPQDQTKKRSILSCIEELENDIIPVKTTICDKEMIKKTKRVKQT